MDLFLFRITSLDRSLEECGFGSTTASETPTKDEVEGTADLSGTARPTELMKVLHYQGTTDVSLSGVIGSATMLSPDI